MKEPPAPSLLHNLYYFNLECIIQFVPDIFKFATFFSQRLYTFSATVVCRLSSLLSKWWSKLWSDQKCMVFSTSGYLNVSPIKTSPRDAVTPFSTLWGNWQSLWWMCVVLLNLRLSTHSYAWDFTFLSIDAHVKRLCRFCAVDRTQILPEVITTAARISRTIHRACTM